MTHENKFGMFIHWGLYGATGVQDQVFARMDWPREKYEGLMQSFNPVKYDPEKWVLLAKDAGMEYICFTTKHHDGFCMWDTAYSDYKITNTPYGKDVLKMLADACQKHGMKLSFYYSCPDWNHPYGYNPASTHQWKAPRIGVIGLVSERDSLLLSVEALYEYGDLLANGNYVSRICNGSPRKLGLMYHSVDSAKVYECAVSGKALNNSRIYLSFLDSCPEESLLCLLLVTENETDGANSSVTLDLDNLDLYLVALDGSEVSVLRYTRVGCRDEYAVCTNENANSALKHINDLTDKNFSAFTSVYDLLPVLCRINLLLGKLCDSVYIGKTGYTGFNFVALVEHIGKLYGRVVGYLLCLDISCNLCAEVEGELCVGNVSYDSGYDISLFYSFER